MNEIGAHSDSGQHHVVSPATPSISGVGTPHSMLPVMRNGRSVLPVLKRTPAAASASRALSRSSHEPNVRSNELALGSPPIVWGGSVPAIASYASWNVFWM